MQVRRNFRGFAIAAIGVVGALGAVALLSTSLSAQRPATFSAAAQRTVTFSKDIAPIFQKSCGDCHRPDSIAPMSLMTYDAARPWARSIKQRVQSREMP